MNLKKNIGNLFLKLHGWSQVMKLPDIRKCVCAVAPHTSIADFFFGVAYFWANEIPFKVMIKAEFFRFPFRRLLLKMGGIPVDRGKHNNLVQQMVEMFDSTDEVYLIICPEGTRKMTPHWKKGFYYIAQGAQVPIILGYIDYSKKCCGIERTADISGDYEKDLAVMWDYYKDKKAKHPANFNLDEQYR